MEIKAKQLAQILKGTVDGDPEALVTTFAKIEHGKPGALCFYANPKYEHYVYTCKASVLLVNKDFKPKNKVEPTMVRVEDAYRAVADLLHYVASKKYTEGCHRGLRSRWFLTTKFGKKVYLGDFSYVGHHARIGDYTKIYENVYVGDNVTIGTHCILYPGVRIYAGMVIGNNVIIHSNAVIGSDGFGNAPRPDGSWEKIEHMGNVIIGNDVEIGACTTIDKSEMESTIIGNGVKIDNLCQIAHNVQIGDNTAIAAQSGIAGSAKIGKNCILAGQVGVAGHLTIADHTILGAQAGVIGNIRKSDQVLLGSPAIPIKTYFRSYALFKKAGENDEK
ncbi:MAG: UDP-3-O-(3-hydroxymyristoyl)glucosamine N-acyltransferase [Bacteroidales bacterium]|jgi:UDP-3-O-[3-hydroxymyristoyl] glucosamine N-acyltransferase|nr:UDP-3-O-(3-hydroxymyristoyl)glucosamine N-acyltransferase [Bacteroidales bacterium]MCI1785157.1 UDP-3-O-(3-hydroxymyristoyl)glucosamine N-acyltransferase [Bacteroidales bacterium]